MTPSHVGRAARHDEAIQRWSRFLASHLDANGSLRGVDRACTAAMPVPVYAHAVGDMELLARSLHQIEHRCLHDTEAFLRPDRQPLLPYRSAWMSIGAVLGEQLRLSAWLDRWTLAFLHKPTGGYFGTEAARHDGEGEICADSTAMACAAFCYSGNLAEADRAGRFLVNLIEAQPKPDTHLFVAWDTQRGLVTKFDEKAAAQYVIEWAKPRQHLYKVGLFARAFALLHARTGRNEHLQRAESLQKRAIDSSPSVFTNTLAHKLAWSATLLHQLTRNPEYAEQACRYADHLVTLQQPDGGFGYPEFWPPYDRVALDLKINIGCQFSAWIAYARRDHALADSHSSSSRVK